MRQIHRSALPGRQTGEAPLLERRIRHAYLYAADALSCRPEPREAFDNVARNDLPRTPWRAFGAPLRAVCAAAASIGGPLVDVVRTRVLHAVLAFASWVLEPIDEGVPVATLLYSQLMREQAEALEAQALAQGLGTTEARAFALEQTRESITAQRVYCAALTDESAWAPAHSPLIYSRSR